MKRDNAMKNKKVLTRERVNHELEAIFDYPLTILSASMGYGKTTAMRTFLESKDVQTAWISLQGSDGDEAVFWHKLCREVKTFYPEIGAKLEGMGFPMDARQMVSAAECMWEMDNGQSTAVVLDDYHLIQESHHVNRFIENLVWEDIPDLHVILISRTRPALNRSELLSKGLCLEMDNRLLAFTLPELQEYSKQAGYQVSRDELEQIYRYTKGWISAAYLLLMGLSRGIPVTEITDIGRLVRDNLFTCFDQETQQILLELSLLEHFTLSQATAILGNPRVPEIVDNLVEQNAFVEYDRHSGVYRLHNVLLDFLRESVHLRGTNLKTVCHRAGQWFLEQDNLPEAFAFYWRAEKIEELFAFINRTQNADIGYLAVDLYAEIYRKLPQETIFRYPLPMLQFACSFILSGKEALAKSGVEMTEAFEEHFRQPSSADDDLRRRILGEIEIIRILIDFNDPEKMIEHSRKAEKLLDGDVSRVIYRDNEFLMGIPHMLYTYYRQPGELKRVAGLIQQGFPPKVFGGCGTGVKDLALAEYALETGDPDNALLYADKALVRAGMEKQIDIMLAAWFVKMRTAMLEGEPAKADRLLEQTDEWFERQRPELTDNRKGVFGTMLELIRAYIYGCLRQAENIPDWLKEGDLSRGVFMYRGMAFPCIIACKAALSEKHYARLEAMCEGFMEYYGYLNNQLGLLHNSACSAAAKYSLYGTEAGLEALIPALREAQKDSIIMPFVENADILLPLLKQIRKDSGVEAGYLDRLTASCGKYVKGLEHSSKNRVILTSREREVLGLLSQGLTQKEMADRMYLSLAAVKKHLGNIYLKLEVDNKVSAVQKAREANLV